MTEVDFEVSCIVVGAVTQRIGGNRKYPHVNYDEHYNIWVLAGAVAMEMALMVVIVSKHPLGVSQKIKNRQSIDMGFDDRYKHVD